MKKSFLKDFGQRIVDTAVKEPGGLDVVVNNTGYTWDNVIQKMSASGSSSAATSAGLCVLIAPRGSAAPIRAAYRSFGIVRK